MRDMQPESGLTQDQYAAIATFRFELRRFLAFSEAAAAVAGLPPQQHQALLAIAGHAGPEAPTVGVLAEQLLVAPHTAAELVSRMVASSLVTRTASMQDRRRTELTLTTKAKELLYQLTEVHLEELKNLAPVLERVANLKKKVQYY